MTSVREIDFASEPLPGEALHRALAELRRRGPVVPVTFGGRPAWLILGHAELTQAFKDEAAFPAGEQYRRTIEPIQGRTFESMDGEEHHRVRQLATPAFRSRAIERWEATGLRALAHELVDGFARESQVDLVQCFTRRLAFLVITRMLGIPSEREQEFVGWAQGILSFDRAAARAFSEYALPVVAERRREPREDVISELVRSELDGRRFSDEEILSHVRLLFSAGATTTHDALGSMVYALLRHPEALETVRAEPARLGDAVEELLRWETPVANLPRVTLTGATLAGVEIPPEGLALFGITGANRDPEIFDEPDRFLLGRDTKRKLSFGLGSHSCPGLHLARKEIRVATEVLLERLPRLALADEPAARPRGTTIRGPAALQVAL
ncbi:MAG: cytochrome P450 [Myxococcota bacterium]